MSAPIKRNKLLQPISREHHHGLLLSWKIRQGISKKVDPLRIKKYVDWFFENHLIPHFEFEEKHIFTILDPKHELVVKALSEHRRLQRLATDEKNVGNSLSLFEEELEQHIRFEERILFTEVQQHATAEHWEELEKQHHDESFVDNTSDEFWK